MTTAALLAKLGRRALVIEQHYVPGGFTHMFNRPGYSWDVGVHAVGEVTRHSLTGRILDWVSGGELRWASLGPVYDEFYFPDGFRVDFPDSPRQFRENLVAAFPGQRAAIDDYLRRVRQIAGGMRAYYLSRLLPRPWDAIAEATLARRVRGALQRTTAEVLAEITDDRRLKTVLAAQWAYYGSPPSRSSFAMQALVAKHFSHGGYYPLGGAGQIARTLMQTVADAGGWTLIATDVRELLVERGRVRGVLLADGREIRAGRVISGAGVQSTVTRLLPDRLRGERWAREVERLAPAPAHVCLYLGFKGDIRTAGAGAANKWFYNVWDAEREVWEIDRGEPLPEAPVLYCSFPSLKDPEHDPGPEQRHTGEVVTFVPWSSFERWRGDRWKKRGPGYDELKQRLHDSLLEQFLGKLPALREMVDYTELSTPATTEWFTRPMRGSIYGLEPTPERFRCRWLRPRSPVNGLFFSGSEVAAVGVIGAMMGGVLAALAAEPVGVLRALRRLG